MTDTLFTTSEVAAMLRVTRQAVAGWCRSGKLKATRAGKGWRIRDHDLGEFVRKGVPKAIERQLLAA